MNMGKSLRIITSSTAALLLAVGVASAAPQASLTLNGGDVALCNYTDTSWTLAKTIESFIDTDADTAPDELTFDITATRGATSPNYIAVDGYVEITNTGTAPATIGNIVVNLQYHYGPKWLSLAADVANATVGDDATAARILAQASEEDPDLNSTEGPNNYSIEYRGGSNGDIGTFVETEGSGSMTFTNVDALSDLISGNDVWNIEPQKQIEVGETVRLMYSAQFDNSVLNIAAGTALKTEFIVSFGNVGPRGGSGAAGADVDIDGDTLDYPADADEQYIRSVPTRKSLDLPPLSSCNDSVTLDDDYVLTGSATFDTVDAVGFPMAIAATTSVDHVYHGVTGCPGDGGSITNTATLTGASETIQVGPATFHCCNGISLSSSASQSVPCFGPAFGPDCEFTTWTKGAYGAPCGDGNGGGPGFDLFRDNFIDVFSSGGVSIGNGGLGYPYDVNGGFYAHWTADLDGYYQYHDYLTPAGQDYSLDYTYSCNSLDEPGKNWREHGAECWLNCVGQQVPGQGQCQSQPAVAVPVCRNSAGCDGDEDGDNGNNSNKLTANTTNAECLSAGNLGQQVATLTLNVALSAAGLSHSDCDGATYGDLVLCNVGGDGVLPSVYGDSVLQVLGKANRALALGLPWVCADECLDGYDYGTLTKLVTRLNEAFHYQDDVVNGVASAWAETHLICE